MTYIVLDIEQSDLISNTSSQNSTVGNEAILWHSIIVADASLWLIDKSAICRPGWPDRVVIVALLLCQVRTWIFIGFLVWPL